MTPARTSRGGDNGEGRAGAKSAPVVAPPEEKTGRKHERGADPDEDGETAGIARGNRVDEEGRGSADARDDQAIEVPPPFGAEDGGKSA